MKAKRRDGTAEALSLLGLARRAGSVVRGTEATRRALRNDEIALVLVADDASPNQLEKVLGRLRHGAVPWREAGDRVALGAAVGSGPLSVVGVTRASFAEQIVRRLGPANAHGRVAEGRKRRDEEAG